MSSKPLDDYVKKAMGSNGNSNNANQNSKITLRSKGVMEQLLAKRELSEKEKTSDNE